MKEGFTMVLDKYKDPFLGRMRKPEGLPPKFTRGYNVVLGTNPTVVFEASLALSLLLVICGFVFFPEGGEVSRVTSFSQEMVKIEDVDVTRQQDRPPPPPRPLIPIEAPADEVLDDATIRDTELRVAESVAPPPPKTEEDEAEYFVAVEEMPELKGGMEAIMRNLVYPELAIRAGLQGVVYVVAYINEKGDVDRAEVLKGIGGGCNEAALEAVKKAKFIPGRQRGRPMKTRVSIPIRFNLTTSRG